MLILGSRLTAVATAAPQMRRNSFAPVRELAQSALNGASHSTPNRSRLTTAKTKLEEIEELGRRCKEGDCAAWSQLFPKIWPVLVTFVHRLYRSFDQQDADAKFNYEFVKKKLEELKKQQQQQSKRNNVQPSEDAKKAKAEADEAVRRREYKPALEIMENQLRRDSTTSYYSDYIRRLKEINDVKSVPNR